jgi:hypothetical protein
MPWANPPESLEPPAASSKDQEENHDHENQAEPSTAVITDAGTHVITAAAKQEQEKHENED